MKLSRIIILSLFYLGTNLSTSAQYLEHQFVSNWNNDIQDFEPAYKYSNVYNGVGYLDSILEFAYDDRRSEYVFRAYVVHTYDGNGLLIEKRRSVNYRGPWEEVKKEVFSYDANGNHIDYLEYTMNSGTWDLFQKKSYTYDSNGLRLSESSYSYRSGQEEPMSRETYTYTPSGKVEEITTYFWDNNQWKAFSNTTIFKYNNKDRIVERTSDQVDQELYTYDNNGYLRLKEYKLWYTNGYEDNVRYQIIENPDQTIREQIYQNWNTPDSEWTNVTKTEFTYLSKVGIEEFNDTDFSVYPNPCQNLVSIHSEEHLYDRIRIVAMSGKVVQESAFCNTIDVSMLPQGNYIVELLGDGNTKVVRKKFIKLDTAF